jgi:hypothetical protein
MQLQFARWRWWSVLFFISTQQLSRWGGGVHMAGAADDPVGTHVDQVRQWSIKLVIKVWLAAANCPCSGS